MVPTLTLMLWLSYIHLCKMDFILVKTPLGVLEGYRRMENYKLPGAATDTVDVYLGVPYAKPPTGPRRFMDPEPVEPWTGTRQATHYPPMCIQSNVNSWFTNVVGVPKFRMSEDCLYLNIYAPHQPFKETLYPVMVYFHGGSNKIGSGNYFDGHVLAMLGAVVVLPNFRLGPLGFLTTGDDVIPGNAGFMDQVLVLKWIKDNIRAFWGNPDKVTIFGNSAGGWDVNVHLVSPLSKGLFHGAIIQSGSGLSDLAQTTRDDLTSSFERLASRLKCAKETTEMSVRCLQRVQPVELLYNTLDHYSVFPDMRILPGNLPDMLKGSIHQNISVIIGVTSSEWARFFLQNPVVLLKQQGSVKNLIREKCQDLPRRCLELVSHLYTHWEDINNLSVQAKMLLQINADRHIISPSLRLAELLSTSGTDTFFYLFDHSISVNLPSLKKYHWLSDYSYHESELPFVFGAPFSGARMPCVWHDGRYSDVHRSISHNIMMMWTNFAKTRNPNALSSTNWTKFRPNTSDYLHISRQGTKMQQYLRSKYVRFWNQIFPNLCQNRGDHDAIPESRANATVISIIEEKSCPQAIFAELLWAVLAIAIGCMSIVFIIFLSKCVFVKKGLPKSIPSSS